MIGVDQIDSLFNEDSQKVEKSIKKDAASKHSIMVRYAKLLLPSIAAVLIGLLIIFPMLQKDEKEFLLDITRPKKGELEKLHVEKTILNITDKDNKVNNFTADNIDETSPGSKLIKLTNPDGMIPSAIEDWINIKSPSGLFNQNTNILQLTEDVDIFYSPGMSIEVPDITFDFNASKAHSQSPVKAQGFIGDINAEGFEFYTKTGILIFTGKTHIKLKEDSLQGNRS